MDIFGGENGPGDSKEGETILFPRSALDALSNALERLLEDKSASDVTFIVGESRMAIKAHKAILVARSDYFRNMFCGAMTEAHSSIVDKPNVDPDVFRDILYYMYTGKVRINRSTVDQLLEAADEMQLEDLKALVFTSTFESSGITVHNVFRYLEDAFRYNCNNIVDTLLEYIDTNAFSCLTSNKLLSVSPEVLKLILSRDELDIDEETVFDRVLSYCHHSSPSVSVKEFFSGFAPLIRFPVMDPVFLAKQVEPLGIIPTDLLMEAYKFFTVPESVPQSSRTRRRCSAWSWDIAQSSALLKIEKGITIKSTMDNKWQTALGTRKFTNGRHYFEAQILRQKYIENTWKFNIGVVKDGFDARKHNVALGYKMGNTACWCLIAGRGETVSHKFPSNGQKGRDYGTSCKEGDTVGVLLDITQRKIEFFKNGVSMGVAFTDVDEVPLRPALSVIGEAVFTLRFCRPKGSVISNFTTSSALETDILQGPAVEVPSTRVAPTANIPSHSRQNHAVGLASLSPNDARAVTRPPSEGRDSDGD